MRCIDPALMQPLRVAVLLKIISADNPSLVILRLSVCGLMLEALYGRHSSQYAFVILLKREYKAPALSLSSH